MTLIHRGRRILVSYDSDLLGASVPDPTWILAPEDWWGSRDRGCGQCPWSGGKGWHRGRGPSLRWQTHGRVGREDIRVGGTVRRPGVTVVNSLSHLGSGRRVRVPDQDGRGLRLLDEAQKERHPPPPLLFVGQVVQIPLRHSRDHRPRGLRLLLRLSPPTVPVQGRSKGNDPCESGG